MVITVSRLLKAVCLGVGELPSSNIQFERPLLLSVCLQIQVTEVTTEYNKCWEDCSSGLLNSLSLHGSGHQGEWIGFLLSLSDEVSSLWLIWSL
jgi:hypothetical protein